MHSGQRPRRVVVGYQVLEGAEQARCQAHLVSRLQQRHRRQLRLTACMRRRRCAETLRRQRATHMRCRAVAGAPGSASAGLCLLPRRVPHVLACVLWERELPCEAEGAPAAAL